jgi:DNA polymerase I-like protein with 3'-5' exonuclease and polymerase domains
MGFEFGNLNSNIKKKNRDAIVDDVCLFSQNNGKKHHILFLIEYPIESIFVRKALVNWVIKNFVGYDFDIVSASAIRATDEQIKKNGIFRFYLENKSDFNSFIRPGTIVVPFGYALSAITRSGDLQTDCFHDLIFNRTYFYSPQTGTYVFPINSMVDLFKKGITDAYIPKDNSRQYFALYQFKYIKDHIDVLSEPMEVDRIIIEKIRTKEEFINFCKANMHWKKISWDIETTGLDYILHRILDLTISFDGKKGYYIPWEIVDIPTFDELLKDKYQIGSNLKFDVKFARWRGVKSSRISSDTVQLGHLLNEMRFNGLKSLAYHYTPYGGYDEELQRFIDKYHPKDFSLIPVPIRSKYATMDPVVAFRIEEEMQKQMDRIDRDFPPIHENGWTIRRLYEEVKIPSCNSFVEIEMEGLYVDEKKWDENAAIVQSKIDSIKDRLREALQMDLDEALTLSFSEEDEEEGKDELQSGMKLGALLKERGWENLGITKQGWYKTGDEQLERWKQLGHPEAELLQNMHSYLTMQKTFLGKPNDYTMGWRRYVRHHPDGSARIHPSYKPLLMATLRNGCGDPNYQQGPAHAKEWSGKDQIDIANLFKQIYSVPDKDKYYLVTLDYSGFQMRLAAIDSEDPALFNGFKENNHLDVHSKTGFNIFCSNQEFDIEEILIDGKVYFPHEVLTVMRDGKEVRVKVSDIQKSDYLSKIR